ncbi:MAG TPA: CinA family protein [Homoserinimonas sp.]|nr:CinA family protein [Homoserinimonas sp.]
MNPDGLLDEAMSLVSEIAGELSRSHLQVAVAESLTGGKISAQLAAGEGSADWFSGGVVAYRSESKFRVLGVDHGPVVTEKAARQMAKGVRELYGVDLAVSVTGAGGPKPQDGQPVGTVFIGFTGPSGERVEEHHLDGDPERVVAETTVAALRMLLAGIRPSGDGVR